MGERKRTMKLVKKVLNNDKKRKLYTEEELTYMALQVQLMKVARARKKLERKRNQGFG